jgi:diguanylate cyclase (GGDEF)-like protein/PAS domain S-box-containing protein
MSDIAQRQRWAGDAAATAATSGDAFRLLAASSPVGLVLTDRGGNAVWVNDRWRQLTGATAPLPIAFDDVVACIHADDRPLVAARFAEAARRREEFTLETRLARPDGAVRHVRLQGAPMHDDRGGLIGYAGTLVDLTDLVDAVGERERAEHALHRSEARYRKLLDEAPVGQVVSELDGRLIEVNRAFLELIGGSMDELFRRPPETLFHPDDLPELARLTDLLVRGRIDRYQCERRMVRHDGGIVWVAGGTSLLRDGDQVVLHSIIHDITEQKLAEQLLTDSESRHRDVVEALHDAILVIDRNHLQAANQAAFAAFNLPFEALARPETWEAFDPIDRDGRPIPPDERAPIVAMRERRPVTDVVSGLEIPGRGRRWFNTNARPRLRHGELVGAVITFSDITEGMLAAEALRESESRFRTLAESLPVGVYRTDPAGRLTYVNPRWCEITGIGEAQAAGRRALDIVHPDDAGWVVKLLTQAMTGNRTYQSQYRIVTVDGDHRWVNANGAPTVDAETGDPTGFIGSLEDVTPLIQAQEETSRLAGIVEATSDLVGIADAVTDRLVYLNRAARRRFGFVDRRVRDVALDAIYPPDSIERVEREVLPALARGEAWNGELAMTAGDGSTVQVWQTITATLGPDGEVVELSAVGRDVTERRRWEASLAHQATHDALTDLPNRALLLDHLELALARTGRSPGLLALLFLDLDRFKQVNDGLGHDAGDDLLVQAARRIRAVTRPIDTVARLGGDEFVVLCEDVDDEQHAIAVAERISRALEHRPFALGEVEVAVTASIGIALSAGGEAAHPEALLRDADAAMYRAKDAGRARFELFDESMRRRSEARHSLARELTEAIEYGHIVVHYQPCVDLRTGRVSSVEALARWQHPVRGILSPSEFISLAEDTGLVIGLGLRVLSDACHQARAWELAIGADAPRVHVNLSARQLMVPDVAHLVGGVLDATGLDPARLCLEITESVVMDDAHAVIDTLRGLKELGVSIAIDDFGTGYSSLSYLRRFPVDVLKVDQSFVDGLGPDPEDSAIVAAVVNLASTLDLQAVAEGVETADQLDALVRLGCDAAQGYWFARPAGGDAITPLLTTVFAVPRFPDAAPAQVR